MRNHITFDGVSSASKGLYISGGSNYNSPARKRDFVTVVGKNGDIIMNDGQFENIQISYPCFMIGVTQATMEARTRAVADWLHSHAEYAKLTDTYKPDYYRMAVQTGSIDWSLSAAARVAETELTFNCKPQLFFNSGDTVLLFSENGYITNPSIHSSKPRIRVLGSGDGTLIIGDYRLDISNISSYLQIDTEIRYAYKGAQNLNDNVVAYNDIDYLQIDAGRQAVQFSGGITRVQIIPRWWTT